MENQITLVQKPVIEHQLLQIGKSVSIRIQELNLENLIATDDTIKSLKELRADLNKEFAEYEAQRKALKEAVAGPYQEFEAVYKTEITEKYKTASETLVQKIGAFEAKIKTDRTEALKRYFAELCAANNIDFLEWKHAGVEVLLSVSDKKYKEQLTDFVNRVADDILLIQGMDYSAETMAEYKVNGLNASKAIQQVRDRKEAEKLERDRIKAIETNRRTTLLRGMNFGYHDLTKSFHWSANDEVSISIQEVENMSKDDFHKWAAGIEILILEEREKQAPAMQPIAPKPAEPLRAPVEVKIETPAPAPTTEKTYKAVFECEGTMSQLKALGEFMKSNNINYKNL